MKTEWKKELCGCRSTKPEQFERLNLTDWIQRRNIKRAPLREDETEAGWECESRFISQDIYEELVNMQTSVDEAVQSATSDIRDNETTIMEAIADLYELVSQ